MKALLSEAYAKIRWPLIDPHQASLELRPGDPYQMKSVKKGMRSFPTQGGTTTLTVVDRWGNMVAARPSGWQHGRSGWEYGRHSWRPIDQFQYLAWTPQLYRRWQAATNHLESNAAPESGEAGGCHQRCGRGSAGSSRPTAHPRSHRIWHALSHRYGDSSICNSAPYQLVWSGGSEIGQPTSNS